MFRVCVMEQVADARYQWPSRTVIEEINPDIYIQMCVDWFSKRAESWNGPLLIEPSNVSLLVGESTGTVRRNQNRREGSLRNSRDNDSGDSDRNDGGRSDGDESR